MSESSASQQKPHRFISMFFFFKIPRILWFMRSTLGTTTPSPSSTDREKTRVNWPNSFGTPFSSCHRWNRPSSARRFSNARRVDRWTNVTRHFFLSSIFIFVLQREWTHRPSKPPRRRSHEVRERDEKNHDRRRFSLRQRARGDRCFEKRRRRSETNPSGATTPWISSTIVLQTSENQPSEGASLFSSSSDASLLPFSINNGPFLTSTTIRWTDTLSKAPTITRRNFSRTIVTTTNTIGN